MNANKIHYAKTLENIYNTDWNDWIETHKNNDIDVVYTMWSNLHKTEGMEVGQVIINFE